MKTFMFVLPGQEEKLKPPEPPRPEGPEGVPPELIDMIKQAILAAKEEEPEDDDIEGQDQGALARHTFDTMTAALQRSESIKRAKRKNK